MRKEVTQGRGQRWAPNGQESFTSPASRTDCISTRLSIHSEFLLAASQGKYDLGVSQSLRLGRESHSDGHGYSKGNDAERCQQCTDSQGSNHCSFRTFPLYIHLWAHSCLICFSFAPSYGSLREHVFALSLRSLPSYINGGSLSLSLQIFLFAPFPLNVVSLPRSLFLYIYELAHSNSSSVFFLWSEYAAAFRFLGAEVILMSVRRNLLSVVIASIVLLLFFFALLKFVLLSRKTQALYVTYVADEGNVK